MKQLSNTSLTSKYWFYIIIAIIIIICAVSCSSTNNNQDTIEEVPINNKYTAKINDKHHTTYYDEAIISKCEFEGHSYLLWCFGHYKAGAVHDPNCSCHNLTDSVK